MVTRENIRLIARAPWLVRLHCSRVHPLICETLDTKSIYMYCIVENKRFELLKMNLISPDTLFELMYIHLS